MTADADLETAGAGDGPPADSPFAAEARPGALSSSADETRPGVPRRRGRWFRRRGRTADGAPATSEKKPKITKKPGRRLSAVDDIEDLFIYAGSTFGRVFALPATGRVMAANASTDAIILDDALAKTPVDRFVLQPVVRNRQRFESLLAVFEMPVIMGMIEIDPTDEKIERLTPSLVRAVRRALPVLGPAMVKVRAREAKLAEQARELYGEEFGIPEFDEMGRKVDPVAFIVADFLRPIYEARAAADGAGTVTAIVPSMQAAAPS